MWLQTVVAWSMGSAAVAAVFMTVVTSEVPGVCAKIWLVNRPTNASPDSRLTVFRQLLPIEIGCSIKIVLLVPRVSSERRLI